MREEFAAIRLDASGLIRIESKKPDADGYRTDGEGKEKGADEGSKRGE